MEMKNDSSVTRAFELDVLRFFAAIVVVIYHLTYRQIEGNWLFPTIDIFSRYGYLGVNLFFLISGFVIIWSAEGRSAKQFLINRFSRLYPIFWVSIAITIIALYFLQGITFDFYRIFANMTMAAGYLGADYIDDVYWTLQVELKFYFLVLLLIVSRQTTNLDRWLAVWLAGSVAAIFWPSIAFLVIYPYGPYFIAGATFYLVWRSSLTTQRGIILAICWALSLSQAVSAVPHFIVAPSIHSSLVAPTIVSCFYLILLGVALGHLRIGEQRYLYKLAVMTYPLYLLHDKFGKAVYDSLDTGKYLSLVTVLLVLFTLCYALAMHVDRPLNTLSKRLLNRMFSG